MIGAKKSAPALTTNARMAYRAPIEPKDVDAIVDCELSGRSSGRSPREAPADVAPSASSIN
jgi:hypothetical protein